MKGNNTIPIGGELESIATGGVVVSADGVRDYKRDKSQEQVNDEVLGNYNVLTALYEAIDKSDMTIVADHTAVTEPQTNTIYREQGDTSYIDWMWDGTTWKKMAEYDNAIDDVPTAGSDNLVKSGGVRLTVNAELPYIIISEEAGKTSTYHPISVKQGHTYRLQKTENWDRDDVDHVNFTFRVDKSSSEETSVQLKYYARYIDFTADKDYNWLLLYNSPATAGGIEEIYFYDLSELLINTDKENRQRLIDVAMSTNGFVDNVNLKINTSQYLTKRKDFEDIKLFAGKTYKVTVTSTSASDLSTSGFYFYSSNDATGSGKSALVKEIGTVYDFTCQTDGVLRFYDTGGANNEELSVTFIIYNEDALCFEKADDGDLKQLEEYIDNNVAKLEDESQDKDVVLTRTSYDSSHTLDGYLQTSGSLPKFVESELYCTCYFIAEQAGTLYVNNTGGGYFNLVIGDVTLDDLRNAQRWPNGSVMPSQESPATVNVGDLVAVSFIKKVNNADNDFELVYTYTETRKYVPNENIREYDDVLEYIHNGNTNPKITIKKVSDDEIRLCVPTQDGSDYLIHPIVHNSYTYDMTQYGGTANMVCGDNWDPGDTMDSSGNTIVQGNLNFIYKVDDTVTGFENENLHVGTGGGASGHGLEVREWTKFFADGREIDVESMDEDITCSVFRIIQKSNCYAPDSTISSSNAKNYPKLLNGNPIVTAQHYLDAEYEIGNRITWRNKLIIRRNGVVFNQLHGAMLRSFTNRLNEVIVNDNKSSCNHFEYSGGQYVLTPVGDSNTLTSLNVKADEANMYGNNIHIYQRMVQDDGARFGKSLMMCNKYEQTGLFSFKIYFMPALVSVRSSVASSETFNSGDVISVTNIRVITNNTAL